MSVAISVSLFLIGGAAACLPLYRPAYTAPAERAAGLLLFAGLALFGMQLPCAV
jgi:hypothetical protein